MSTATQIADVFNHVHQSHPETASTDKVLADVATRIGYILADAGMCSRETFTDAASMSGLNIS